MAKNVGVWIDHREATLVSLTGETETITQIASDIESDIRSPGGPVQVTAEDMRDRRYANLLTQFYKAVIDALQDAEAILIIGPGEAKGELAKQLEATNLAARVVGVETVDKMTERQIAAHVRERFKPGR